MWLRVLYRIDSVKDKYYKDNNIFKITSNAGGTNASGQSNGSVGMLGIAVSLPQGKALIENNHI